MQEVLVSKIFNYTSTPTKNVEGQFWFNPSTNVLSRYNGTVWKPITVSSDDVAVLTDGSKVSLTSYLNTQIAALAEGIDSKQDKLETYKEKQGDRQINTTISSSASDDGGYTGDIIIHTNGVGDIGGVPHPGNITLSTGESGGMGGSITLTTGDEVGGSATGSSLVLDRASDGGNITLSAGETTSTPGNITLEAAEGNLELNVAKITGSAVDTTISSSSTDSHIPTSKAVYDALTLKQNTLQFYTESITDAPGYPSGSGIYKEQISLGKNNYSQTINIGGSNNLQNINLGGSVGTYGIITIGTTGNNNQIQIGRDNTNTTLEINTATLNGNAIDKTALTESSNKLPTSQAVLNGLSAKQNTTDNNLTTTDKTIVGAINELSANKQNTLKYFSESDSSTVPSSNNAQVSILKSSDYQTTLNLGFESSNGIQTVNIGGSSNTRNINIGTKVCGQANNVIIGNASDGVLLTLNTGRGLAGTGVTKDLSTSATDAQFPTAAAVNNQLILKQNITDNTLTTADKTIVGAINELKTATDAMVVVSTDNAINVAPTTAQTGILIASSKTNGGNVIITPKITNTGACYLSTSSTYSNLNPIYPDPTNNKYTYPNLGTVYLFVDNAGDSADIVIENFAG